MHEVSGFNECMTDSVTCGQESKYDRIRCRLQKSQGVEPDFWEAFPGESLPHKCDGSLPTPTAQSDSLAVPWQVEVPAGSKFTASCSFSPT